MMDSVAPGTVKLFCCVCGEPVPALQQREAATAEFPLCRSFDCNRFVEQRRSLPANLFRAQLEFLRTQFRELKSIQQDRERRISARVAEEERQNQQLLDTVLEHRPALAEGDVQLMVIPAGRTHVAPVPPQRIDNYRTHLQEMLAAAEECISTSAIAEDRNLLYVEDFERNSDRFQRTPELQAVSNQLCAMCRGACCSSGGDHAYLSPLILRRMLDANPELGGEDIVARYLSCVATEAVEGSCINQTASGCSLPRDMRSDTCNAYFCDPILNYHRDSEEAGVVRTVFAVQRENTFAGTIDPDTANDVLATALVTADRLENLPEEID